MSAADESPGLFWLTDSECHGGSVKFEFREQTGWLSMLSDTTLDDFVLEARSVSLAVEYTIM